MKQKAPIPFTRPIGWTNKEWYAELIKRIPPSVRHLTRESVWEIRARHRPVGRAGEAPKWDDRLTSKQLAVIWSRRLNCRVTKPGIDFLVKMPHELSLAFKSRDAIAQDIIDTIEAEREKPMVQRFREGLSKELD